MHLPANLKVQHRWSCQRSRSRYLFGHHFKIFLIVLLHLLFGKMALAILTSEVKTAYTSASNGDTLLLTTGTFSDSGQFSISKTITIRCENDNTCTFDGLNNHRVIYVTSGTDGVLNLEGIIVTKGVSTKKMHKEYFEKRNE